MKLKRLRSLRCRSSSEGRCSKNYVFSLHSGIPSRYRSEYCEEVSNGVFFEPSFQHVLDYTRSEDYREPPDGVAPSIRVFCRVLRMGLRPA